MRRFAQACPGLSRSGKEASTGFAMAIRVRERVVVARVPACADPSSANEGKARFKCDPKTPTSVGTLVWEEVSLNTTGLTSEETCTVHL